MSHEIICDINFTDPTILECEASFSELEKLMKREETYVKKWMVPSSVSISVYSGNDLIAESMFILQFYNNKEVVIMEYSSSNGEVFSNPEIRGLIDFLYKKGWEKISIHPFLIDENIKFWRFFWETGLLESSYLDRKIGKIDTNEDTKEDNK